MNTREIEKLLEKYEEGLTTTSEEKELKEFFRGPDVPENLRHYVSLFRYFDQARSEKITDPDFDLKTDHLLTHAPPNATRRTLRVTRYASRVTYFSIAASILLIIGLFFTFRQDIFKKNVRYDSATDAVYAYAEVQQALLTVSANLNIGLDQFRRFEPIGKAMQNVQKFSKFYQYQPIIINQDIITDKSINH
jgi:hypothetical protein